MDDSQGLQVLEASQQLDSEATDKPVVEALVVVHFDKLVEIDRVEVEHEAEMVAPHEVVNQFDDALHIIRVVFFQQQQQFSLDSRLVVVLLLVLNNLDGDRLATLVVNALND